MGTPMAVFEELKKVAAATTDTYQHRPYDTTPLDDQDRPSNERCATADCQPFAAQVTWQGITADEKHPIYVAQYGRLKALFEQPGSAFRLDAIAMSQSVLQHRNISPAGIDAAAVPAAEYLLKEFACILAAPALLQAPSVEIVYHTGWPLLASLLDGAKYGLPPTVDVTFRLINAEDDRCVGPSPTQPAVVLCAMSIGNSYYSQRNIDALKRQLPLCYPPSTRIVPFVPDATCTFTAIGYTDQKARRLTRQNSSRLLRWFCGAQTVEPSNAAQA